MPPEIKILTEDLYRLRITTAFHQASEHRPKFGREPRNVRCSGAVGCPFCLDGYDRYAYYIFGAIDRINRCHGAFKIYGSLKTKVVAAAPDTQTYDLEFLKQSYIGYRVSVGSGALLSKTDHEMIENSKVSNSFLRNNAIPQIECLKRLHRQQRKIRESPRLTEYGSWSNYDPPPPEY